MMGYKISLSRVSVASPLSEPQSRLDKLSRAVQSATMVQKAQTSATPRNYLQKAAFPGCCEAAAHEGSLSKCCAFHHVEMTFDILVKQQILEKKKLDSQKHAT